MVKRLLSLLVALLINLSLFAGISVAAEEKVNSGVEAEEKINSSVEAEKEINPSVEAVKIESTGEDLGIKLIYPYLSGFKAAEQINDAIQRRNISLVGYIREAEGYIKEIKKQQVLDGREIPTISAAMESYYDYNYSGDILSIILNFYEYTGGAHGSYYLDSYNVNTRTNEIYGSFSSLFDSKSNYKTVIREKINKLIDSEKEMYFEDAKKTVAAKNSDYKFYIDGNQLVIYFDLYELRPYAGGMPFFSINAEELKGLLKSEVYTQMVKAKPLEAVRYNGTTLEPQFNTYTKDYTLMVPLVQVADKLGYKVTWDPKKGAGIAGGYVKSGLNSYYTDKSPTKTKLSTAPQIKDNRMFVPVDFFSGLLNEDVFYDGDVLRLFKVVSSDIHRMFKQQIIEYIYPKTAEAAVKMYAQAVKDRKGAIQYALYSGKLKAEKKHELETMNWVTGVSSPWVTGYTIKNKGNNKYDIVFNWATSAGKAPSSTVNITVGKVKDMDYWEITAVKG